MAKLILTLFFVTYFNYFHYSQSVLYVSTHGDDRNDGSTSTLALATLYEALSLASSLSGSVTIRMEKGDYRVTLPNNLMHLSINRSDLTIEGGYNWNQVTQNRTRLIPQNAKLKFIFIDNRENVVINNIDFEMSENTLYTSLIDENTDLEGYNNDEAWQDNPCAIWIDKGGYNTIKNCIFMNARNDMIVVKISSYNMIDGNTLGQVRVPGDLANSISIEGEYKYESNTYTFTGAHHNTIKNNRIYPNRSHFGINLDVFPNGSGVWGTNQIYSRDVYNEYNEIAYNIIEGCEAGIYATHQKYLKIHNNFIGYNFKRENDENGFVESDEGHGITMNGRFPKYNGTSNQDFYIWDSESLINNNTIYLSYNMGIHNSHATSVTLFNNLISHNGFYNNTVQPNLNAGKFGMRQANPTINDNFIHNMYFRGATGGATTITDYWRLGSTAVNWTNWTTSQGELNSVETEDPQFRNLPSYPSTIPSPNDFPLLNVSDFISLESSYPQNNGTNSITGISSEDILGNSRSGDWDMGAFEIGEIYPPFIESVNFYDQIVEVNFTEDFYETSRSFYPTIYHISPYNSNFSDVKMLGESWTTTRQYLIETDHHIADNFYILHLNNFSNNLPHFQTIRYKATGLSKKGNYVNKMINFELLQNYPNPFNPYTKINFTIPTSNNVSLILYNILGQEIQSLVNGNLEAGSHSINFDAASLPSGIYFYKLTSGKYTEVRKMQLIK